MNSTSEFLRKILSAKGLACIGALALIGTRADAADMDWVKAPPVMPDLTWHGITVIGAYDVSGQYLSAGAPYLGPTYSSPSIIGPMNRTPTWLIAPNQSMQSYIGLKVDEGLTDDLHFLARFEMGFDPTTGQIADTLRSMQLSNGVPLNQQAGSGDGPRAGQILNGDAWAGFQYKNWGELHVGRQLSVTTDMLGAYDPLSSYGFSLFANVGIMPGAGGGETVRVDGSVKYLNNWGPFRAEAMYGNPGTNVAQFYQGSFGYVKPNFSVDVFGGHASDLVLAAVLSGAANFGSQYLGARIMDTNSYGIFGKYVFDLGQHGLSDPNESRFILSGGYMRIDFSNPSDGGVGVGHETIGGYELGPILATNGSSASGIVSYAFTGGDRELNASFIAGKYQYDSQWSASVGYYRYDQGSYGLGVNGIPGIVAPGFSNTSCSTTAFINCGGTEQVASFRVDYDWTKNLKLYAGVAYSKVSGGFGFSFLNTSMYDPTVGMRFTF
jgi:predicted porin